MQEVVLALIDLYEQRIATVGTVLNRSYQLKEHCRKKRRILSQKVGEYLAGEKSFRKTDYEQIMAWVGEKYRQKEEEITALIEEYLHEHRMLAQTLRRTLIAQNKIRSFQEDVDGDRSVCAFFTRMREQQEESEGQIKRALHLYEQDQAQFIHVMTTLQEKGAYMTMQEVKQTLCDLVGGEKVEGEAKQSRREKQKEYHYDR